MFTGIVQSVGRVIEANPSRLIVDDPGAWPSDPWSLGESIAVNGCCLTLVGYVEPGLTFDISRETWDRTALRKLRPGHPVNLERAMRAEDRFGGHFVQGHVDGVGTYLGQTEIDGSWQFEFDVPEDRYLVSKGSIAIEGVSLTVVEPAEGTFSVWVVPHTYKNTVLSELKPNDPVNVEYDMLARYVERLVSPR